jgi:uncharacterized protein (DUF2267 family)
MDAETFYRALGQRLGMDDRQAVRVAEACLFALHLRMPEPEARELRGMLPRELQQLFEHGGEALKEQRGSVSDFSRAQFLDYIADRLGLPSDAPVARIVTTCYAVLREQLPEADEVVLASVPEDIRDLWIGPVPRAG